MKQSKQELRCMARACCRSMAPALRQAGSEEICRRLMQLPEIAKAQIILSYAAMSEEPDLSGLHAWLWAQGKTLAFPVVEGHGIMHAVAAAPDSQWQKGSYGIREPVGEPIDPAAIDLVIAPCVAFDAQCHRLGHGGGYYDRFLPQCEQARCIVAAFDVQCLASVPADGHDWPVEQVITEQRIYERMEKDSHDRSDGKNTDK